MSPERKFVLLIASPLWVPTVVFGFLWQFIDYGWTVGNVAFNRLFQRV